MNRFSVIYKSRKQYCQIFCETHPEADTVLQKLYAKKKKTPVGIYDAKTELFYWEPIRQRQIDQLTVQEQGKLGNEMIATVQMLRNREGHGVLNAPGLQSDILQRPIYLI